MAAQLLNSLGRIGLGLAVGASVVNTALYNGIVPDAILQQYIFILLAYHPFYSFSPYQLMVVLELSSSIASQVSRTPS